MLVLMKEVNLRLLRLLIYPPKEIRRLITFLLQIFNYIHKKLNISVCCINLAYPSLPHVAVIKIPRILRKSICFTDTNHNSHGYQLTTKVENIIRPNTAVINSGLSKRFIFP